MLNKILLYFGILVIRAIGLLPYRLMYCLFSLISRIAYCLASRHRQIAINNIKDCFHGSMTEEKAGKIAKTCFKNLALMFLDLCRMPRITKDNFREYIHFEGLENVHEAEKHGKGILVCTGHFGSWELLPHAWSLYHGRPAHVVVRPLDNKVADRVLSYFRTFTGNRLIAKKKALMPIMKALAKNDVVGTLHDQNVKKREGIFVDFFGRPACTTFAPALIGLRTGGAVIPAYIVREGINSYRIIFEKEVTAPQGMEKEEAIFYITQTITKSLENMIRKYPEQWFWVHRRWKTKPH